MMKKIVMVMILLLIGLTGYSYDRKGTMLGFEGNFSLVDTRSTGWQETNMTFLFGGTVIAEVGFNDYLSLAFGVGGKYYSIDAVSSPNTTVKYRTLMLDIPIGVRFRPMPLLSKDKSSFSFFVGIGFDLMIPIYSKREIISGGISSKSGGLKSGTGFIYELGFGWYLSDNTLTQFTFKYNTPFSNLGSKGDTIKPNFFDFGLGIFFRL